MSQKYEKLKTLLKELFQLDQPDLDFGLYRIMHAKSAEVNQFLDQDLLPQVKAAFGLYQSADKAEIEKELAKAIEAARALGVDPESTQKVKELRAKLAGEAVDVNALEAEVYDHLYGFFRRYYSDGDFLSKRVYKPGVYAIPYEGEEVKLHWANADQYYIKTSEYFRDYAFRLRPDDAQNPMRVHFRLADAAEGEPGNVKPANGRERVFVLAASDFVALDGGELVLRFEYRPATLQDWGTQGKGDGETERRGDRETGGQGDGGKTKPPAQKDLTAMAEARILALLAPSPTLPFSPSWHSELSKPHVKSDGTRADYTCLRAHLNRYTARNTFDYFIHKDLGGFLRRELDFYIKNEVMHLDDVESESAPRVEQYLSKIKVMRRVAHKIIAFLAQLEDFQKKLWLKKKFVVETSYCIKLGVIPEEFYPEIAANEAQWAEWESLHHLSELKQDDGLFAKNVKFKTAEFLKANRSLMVDTRHFDADFTVRLLEAIGEVDEQTDGVLVHSENFQALALMQARYREQVKCIYIDPPYNTGDGDFPYRDSYQHSSWIAMMDNRLPLWRSILSDSGSFVCHIDEHELNTLEHVINEHFGTEQNIGPIVWDKRNPKGDAIGIASQHEYLCWAVKNYQALKAQRGFSRKKENAQAILAKAAEVIRRHGGVTAGARDEFKNWMRNRDFSAGEKAYCELDEKGDVYRPVSMAWPNKQKAPDEYFEPLIHPVTKKPCPVPARGWRNPPQTMTELLKKGLILFGPDASTQPTRKYLLKDNLSENVPSLYYFGGSDDDLQVTMGYVFPNPKPVRLGEYVISIAAPRNGDVLFDFFAGSGTTGHAVINLNREDGGQRKFILVEQADYFDTVLLPRLKKVTFTPDWKDGKPKRLATAEEAERSPRVMKVVRLESYEDTLNNLETRRTPTQDELLFASDAQGADKLKEQYLLRYMLEVETRASPSLLNVAAFTDPTSYKLKVKRPGSDESREVNVDLLETFNWLIGLTVKHIAAPQCFTAEFERDSEGRLRLKGRLRQVEVDTGSQGDGVTGRQGGDSPRLPVSPSPNRPVSPSPPHPIAPSPALPVPTWWFRTVTGTMPDGHKALVIWRKRPGSETPEGIEQDNLVLDEWLTKQGYSSKDREFDLIYVNGGNNLENLKTPDDLWKVRLIEEDFFRLMFATEGV